MVARRELKKSGERSGTLHKRLFEGTSQNFHRTLKQSLSHTLHAYHLIYHMRIMYIGSLYFTSASSCGTSTPVWRHRHPTHPCNLSTKIGRTQCAAFGRPEHVSYTLNRSPPAILKSAKGTISETCWSVLVHLSLYECVYVMGHPLHDFLAQSALLRSMSA